jgi:hypothetical protein
MKKLQKDAGEARKDVPRGEMVIISTAARSMEYPQTGIRNIPY